MNNNRRKLLRYVGNHQWALWAALLLACLVGLLEAATPFLLSGVFDTWLGSGTASGSKSVIGISLDLAYLGRTTLLVLLIGVTILKTIAEYGSVSMTAWPATHTGRVVSLLLRRSWTTLPRCSPEVRT